jgi:hypothetical protein
MGSAQVQGMLWGAAAQDWAAFQEATSMPLWTDVLRAAGAGHGIRILDADAVPEARACLRRSWVATSQVQTHRQRC